MRKNVVKEKLSKGGNVLGVIVQEAAPQIVEILGLVGFDWLLIDCLHSHMSLESVAEMIRAAELREITPLVRVPQNVPEIILRYMDVGGMGIMVADMNSKEEAEKAVKGVKYPPLGERGLAGVRAAEYGLKMPLGEYVRFANDETMVWGIVESKEGVDSIEEILDTEGLDSLTIGTIDLSKSLGVPGQTTHPKVLEAVEKVLAAGKKKGKPIGGGVHAGETPKQYLDKGFQVLATPLNGLIAGASKQFLDNAKS